MTSFHPTALEQPLYILDLDALRTKLTTAGGLLQEFYDDFENRILQDDTQRRDMIFLQALLDDTVLEEAAGYLRDYWRRLAQSDTANDYQFHTWCRGGTTTRRVAFFDWLACKGVWSRDDLEEAAEAFVGFAHKHSRQVMRSRRRASDNQIWSMSLNCAVTGFIFGHKRAQHATAKHLFDVGLGRLPDVVGLFPGDGYGGEGSTYTSHVNTGLAFWTAQLFRQLLGTDISELPFKPNGTTLRKMIEMEMHLVSPGGLLAPWDHYGWQNAVNVSPFAYLADITGNAAYLSLTRALGAWESPGFLAWGADDPMWTLIWWPEQFKDYASAELPTELFGWFLPKTGAALEDCPRRTRLMQVWDHCGASMSSVGRGQVNPNHVMLDMDGQPIFQDGIPEKGKNPWPLPLDKILANVDAEEQQRHANYLKSVGGSFDWDSFLAGMAPGLPCAANCIVVDDEIWYWPGEGRVGRAEFYGADQGLQAVTADCANYYNPAYDVRRMRRTSLWTPDGFGLILDTIAADSAHKWTCQYHLRPFVTLDGNAAALDIPNGPQVLFAWDGDVEASVTDEPDFPNRDEHRSQRLDLSQTGNQVQFTLLIAPGADNAAVKRDGNFITVTIDGKTAELAVECFDGGAAFSFAGIELTENEAANSPQDESELEDITVDRDLQYPEIEQLVDWDAPQSDRGSTTLAREDACFAQLKADRPDTALLLAELQSGDWPVQVAAAEVSGRLGIQDAAPVLRRLLEEEHAIPADQLYLPDGEGGEAEAKRWRLKAALIAALGRLCDQDSVALLARMIADNIDTYMVYSCACQALGRIGGEAALAAVQPSLKDTEINSLMRARHAAAALTRP